MPYGIPPKKQKKSPAKLQDVDRRVMEVRGGNRDKHLVGVQGYILHDGMHAVADPCQLPATYGNHGQPPHGQDDLNPRGNGLPMSLKPARTWHAEGGTGRWGALHPVSIHRAAYGTPWFCSQEPGFASATTVQNADGYMGKHVMSHTFNGMLMPTAGTMHQRVVAVLKQLHDVVVLRHKGLYTGWPPLGVAQPNVHDGIHAFTHPPWHGSRSLCIDFDPAIIHAMGMSKWMGCQDGYLSLTLGTVKDEGQRRVKKVRIRAHRFIMFAFVGAEQGGITGKVVMHTCNNRRCMNPAHMLVGSTQQNMREDYADLWEERDKLLVKRAGAVG